MRLVLQLTSASEFGFRSNPVLTKAENQVILLRLRNNKHPASRMAGKGLIFTIIGYSGGGDREI